MTKHNDFVSVSLPKDSNGITIRMADGSVHEFLFEDGEIVPVADKPIKEKSGSTTTGVVTEQIIENSVMEDVQDAQDEPSEAPDTSADSEDKDEDMNEEDPLEAYLRENDMVMDDDGEVTVDFQNNWSHGIEKITIQDYVEQEQRKMLFEVLGVYYAAERLFRRVAKHKNSNIRKWARAMAQKLMGEGVDFTIITNGHNFDEFQTLALYYSAFIYGVDMVYIMVTALTGGVISSGDIDRDFGDFTDVHRSQIHEFEEGFMLASDMQRTKGQWAMLGRHYHRFHQSDVSSVFDGVGRHELDDPTPAFADFADQMKSEWEARKLTSIPYLRMRVQDENGNNTSVVVEHPDFGGKVLAINIVMGDKPKSRYGSVYGHYMYAKQAASKALGDSDLDAYQRFHGLSQIYLELYKQYVKEANDSRNITSWGQCQNNKRACWYRTFSIQFWQMEDPNYSKTLGFDGKQEVIMTLFSAVMDDDLDKNSDAYKQLEIQRQTRRDWAKLREQQKERQAKKAKRPTIS